MTLFSAASLAAAAFVAHSGAAAADPDVWSGVYSDAQAVRGKRVHAAVCSQCHGLRLDGAGQSDMPGAPAIAGPALIRKWTDRSVAALFVYTKAAMPPMNPGSLTEQQYIDAVAYMLKMSGMPSGAEELTSSTAQLAAIIIKPNSPP